MESFLVQQQVGELLGTIAVAPQQSPVNAARSCLVTPAVESTVRGPRKSPLLSGPLQQLQV